jgi:hypothetical protein
MSTADWSKNKAKKHVNLGKNRPMAGLEPQAQIIAEDPSPEKTKASEIYRG